MSNRARMRLLLLLLLLGTLYRLFAAYPTDVGRFAPASSALQAMHILGGERPIFYSGQAWMGPAGAYLIAGLFKLFGASSLTLGLFSWIMSVLFLVGTVLLAYRLFGVDNAIAVAALFLVPVDWVMYLAGQPRAHYTISFVLVPAVFLATLALLRRHREGRPVVSAALLLGLLCGFSFWTNMAIGPAIGVSVLLLVWHMRRLFFSRVAGPWTAGFGAGFLPVIWYNLTNQAVLAGQVNAENSGRIGHILLAFLTNAWPHFWGIAAPEGSGWVLRAGYAVLLAWITALYVGAFVQGWRRWRDGKELLGFQLVFGYLILHLAVTSASSYGHRFTEGTPLSYIVTLYAVALAVPALVLQSGFSRRTKALMLLPLVLLVANNLAANASYPAKFFSTLRLEGLSHVVRYPDPEHPFARYGRERGVEAGYLGRSFRADSAKHQNFPLNLECYGLVTFADPVVERYVGAGLAADAARRPFWVGADPNYLQMIGATSRTERVMGFEVHDDFRKELRALAVIPAVPMNAVRGRLDADFISDMNYDSRWTAEPRPDGEAVQDFSFQRPVRLKEVVLFPADVQHSPGEVIIEVSGDGADWRRVREIVGAAPVFWSVWHPFMKAVKPRMEISLPAGEEARFCRLRFPLAGNRAGLSLREVLFLEEGPVIDPMEWEREIDDVVRVVGEQGRDAVVTGDHWFVDLFRQRGFATDFISNMSINNCGLQEPNLSAPVAIDFSRPQVIIVSNTYLDRVEKLLRDRGVPFGETPFRHHTICRTGPARVDRPLFFNGLELNELQRRDGRRIAFSWPPLRELAPGATATSLRFGDQFEVTGISLSYVGGERRVEFLFEVLPLADTNRDWWIFIHLRDSQGRMVAQGDFQMEQLGYPTSRWSSGTRGILERSVILPPEAKGNITATFGIWEPRSRKGLRLPDRKGKAPIGGIDI